MTVTLTVSQVRQALAGNNRQVGPGNASSAAIGTLFHQVIGELLRCESPDNLQAALDQLDPDLPQWKNRLYQHVYDHLLGPQLTKQAAALQSQGEKVLHLWTAVRNACDFLAEIWWEISDQGRKAVDQPHWFFPERPIACEVNAPNWREPVSILGRPDAVLRIPDNHCWCVLEWKLGMASPEVDLGQACLYHMILNRTAENNGQSALAVVNFRPELEQRPFAEHQLVAAQARLIELIGRVAGVIREVDVSVPPVTPSVVPPAWIEPLSKKMLSVLREFGASCKVHKPPVIGPAFARFFLFPERGITQRKVLSQADQLHLHLALPTVPNMDTIDGAITVDLPRPDRETIPFSKLEPHLPDSNSRLGCSKVPIGVDLSGKWSFCNLAAPESAHLLVVGTPGSGKSQWLRAALSSLIRTNTPQTLQVLLIDPKQNAFTFAASSPYLRRPIVVPDDEDSVADVLSDLIDEMEHRYTVFATEKAQDLTKYLEQGHEPLPRIVLICDEYADLLAHAETTGGKPARTQIEHLFRRIGAKGRAAGIHIILATQYPSRQILTSAIQASLGAKIALRVSSSLESRVALQASGAERLLGNGDLLYKCIGDPVRLQGAWLPESEESLVTA